MRLISYLVKIIFIENKHVMMISIAVAVAMSMLIYDRNDKHAK